MRKVDFESVCESRFEGYRAAGCETSSMGGSDVNVVVRGESGTDEEGCQHRYSSRGRPRSLAGPTVSSHGELLGHLCALKTLLQFPVVLREDLGSNHKVCRLR